MSAFVGIISFDGTAIDRVVLKGLTHYLAQIGPDSQNTLVTECAGFGFALLDDGSNHGDIQPLQADDGSIVVGDVRLDDRETLIGRLGLRHQRALSDIELVLAAWKKWGRKLSDYLRGDFSFVIWAGASKELIAVRDPMGIRTFYYHQSGKQLIFSNALNAVLRYPGVSNEPDSSTLADFLLFHHSREQTATSFKAIRQLAPAHQARFSSANTRVSRYWSLPVEEPLRFRRDTDCIEQFDHLFSQAVSDRLRGPKTNILVSGGMDSTSITIKAREHYAAVNNGDALHLVTARSADSPEAQDHELARRLAGELGLDIQVVDEQIVHYFEPTEQSNWPTPEVFWHKEQRMVRNTFAAMAAVSPNALTGQGGDPLLARNTAYMPNLLRSGRMIKWTRELIAFYRMHGRRPPLGLQTTLRKRFQADVPLTLPRWINPEFAARERMEERLAQFQHAAMHREADGHPTRPETWSQLRSPSWQFILPGHDAQASGQPLNFAHPFFDTRLIRFMLRVSSPKWLHSKTLLRSAMAGQLPGYIRQRQKSVLQGNGFKRALQALGPDFMQRTISPVREYGELVDWPSYATLIKELQALTAAEVRHLMTPLYMADWLSEVRNMKRLGERT